MSGELLCPKNVSFASVVEKPEGGSSANAPSHLHPPTLQCDRPQVH